MPAESASFHFERYVLLSMISTIT